MNTRLFHNSLIVLFLLVCATAIAAQPLLWPVSKDDDQCLDNDPPNGACWRTVNGTAGSIHGKDHFHGAIDIDTHSDKPVRAMEAGRVLKNDIPNLWIYGCSENNRMVTLEHGPVIDGIYTRMSRYLHINPDDCEAKLAPGAPIAAYTELGVVGNQEGEGHSHVELWQLENGQWYNLNPLGNEEGWALRYHQELEGREDHYDPQIHDIIFETHSGITAPNLAPNQVASGFEAYTTVGGGGLKTFTHNGKKYVRAHLKDKTDACDYKDWNGSVFTYPNDRLIVFGNIGMVANAGDIGINSIPGPGTHSGCGLTVHHLDYSIENQLHNIHVPEKYTIDFDRGDFSEREAIAQVFDLTFDNVHLNYGNNDFVELRDDDDTYLSPYPHTPIDGVQSNGIWFTKANAETDPVFQYTPDDKHVAFCNTPEEAKYPDGEYTLRFLAQDDWGHVNRADTGPDAGRDVNAKVHVIVDNFRPYVKDVKITSGSDTFPMYSSAWNWNTTTRELKLRQNAVDEKADMGQPLHIAVTTSEPMKLTTDGDGQPNGSMKVKLVARDPDDPNRIKVSIV